MLSLIELYQKTIISYKNRHIDDIIMLVFEKNSVAINYKLNFLGGNYVTGILQQEVRKSYL